MKVAVFGGSFDPVHTEHVRFAKAAIEELRLDRLIVMPSYRAPHKSAGAVASGEDRLGMCRIAFSELPAAEISDYELRAQGTSYSYLTCRRFREKFPHDTRYFLVGADMLENFFSWREPEDILKNVTLVACVRGKREISGMHAKFRERFGTDFSELHFCGGEVSSSDIRVALAFGEEPKRPSLDPKVLCEIREKGLYRYDAAQALALETPERRRHSYRVALLATQRAKTLGIPFDKALLAAMLHDCGKYVPLSSPMLRGFLAPMGYPSLSCTNM